jgi:hypothetical protein
VFRVQQCTDQNQMVREEIQKYSGFPRENRRPVANPRGLQLKGPFDLNKERFLQNKDYLPVNSVLGDVFRVQQCTDQNQMVREEIQKYIDEHIATSNEDDARDFIDAYLLEIKHHKHEKNTLFTGK